MDSGTLQKGNWLDNLLARDCSCQWCKSEHADEAEIVSITGPTGGEARVRKIVSRSNSRPTGKYPSWKMGRMIEWDSPNELNAFRILDASPTVKSFYEQPFKIKYRFGNEDHIHYPDVLVVYENSRELWEIKPAAQAHTEKIIYRTNALKSALPKYGYTYRLIVAECLRKTPYISNATTLLRNGRNTVSLPEREKMRMLFQRHPRIAWADLRNGLYGKGTFSVACRMLLEGTLRYDASKALNDATNIYWQTSKAEY